MLFFSFECQARFKLVLLRCKIRNLGVAGTKRSSHIDVVLFRLTQLRLDLAIIARNTAVFIPIYLNLVKDWHALRTTSQQLLSIDRRHRSMASRCLDIIAYSLLVAIEVPDLFVVIFDSGLKH